MNLLVCFWRYLYFTCCYQWNNSCEILHCF